MMLKNSGAPQLPMRLPVPFLRRDVRAGDAVAAITQATGIRPCSPCEQRKRALNQRLVFTPWGNR